MRYHNIFFAILKLYFWSIHMANNLILAISFGFKLNSNLKYTLYLQHFEVLLNLRATIPAKSLWPPSEESPPPLPLFQCCYNDVDFSFDIFLNLQNNIGQGVWGKRKPLSNVIVWDCLKELCKICSVVLRHVNLDSLAESRQGKAGSALTLHHIK